MSDTDRDKLILTVRDVDADYHGTGPLALSGAEAALIADAVLARWLPEHDKQVKAEAWDEGLLVGQDPYGFDATNNPYREES